MFYVVYVNHPTNKAIKENWQVPEEYLKAEKSEKQRKEQERIRLIEEKKE